VPSIWEVLQQIASLTRHASELQSDVKQLDQDMRRLEVLTNDRIHAVEMDVAALKAAQATTRETVRAEIATAVADLRVKYVEEVSRQTRPRLGEGKDKK
jgi:archaellum component FlaC